MGAHGGLLRVGAGGAPGIGLPFGLRRWMRLTLPILARNRSFSAER